MASSVGVGTIDPESDRTNGNGNAAATFVAEETVSGTVVVQASYEWSSQKGDIERTLSDTVDLVLGSITGTWIVTGSETVSGCEDPEGNGTYSGTAGVYFEQLGDTFIGFGNFPRESDLITGTVRRTGDTGFTVEGSFVYVEVDEQADRDDDDACEQGYSCTEWTTYGVAGFRGTGSIETQTIDFTWSGHDTEGDTCSFAGRGKATYSGLK